MRKKPVKRSWSLTVLSSSPVQPKGAACTWHACQLVLYWEKRRYWKGVRPRDVGPIGEHLRVGRLLGVESPSFAGIVCHLGQALSLWASVSSAVKDLQDFSFLTSHDSNWRGSSSLLITTANCWLLLNPHGAAIFSSYSKTDRIGTTLSFWPMLWRVAFLTSGWGNLYLVFFSMSTLFLLWFLYLFYLPLVCVSLSLK